MTDNPMDAKLQKLVAALYGELSGDEMQELEKLLAEDDALRAEWEEMQSTRAVLGRLEQKDAAPSFVFLTDEEPARAAFVGESRIGLWGRFTGFLDRLGPGPVWGLAATALLVVILGLSDFRVQRVDGGFALRFGEPLPAVLDDGMLAAGGSSGSSQANVQLAGQFITRNELADYEDQVMRVMGSMLRDYASYRDQELAGIMRNMYADVSSRHVNAYDDLRSRIESLNSNLDGYQSLVEQSDTVQPVVPPAGSNRENN